MTKIAAIKAHRLRDPEANPCLKEADLSTKCLEENHYVKDMCEIAFRNYNNCRSFWSSIVKQRRQAHIEPAMPGEKEREQIKLEHANGRYVISAPVYDQKSKLQVFNSM